MRFNTTFEPIGRPISNYKIFSNGKYIAPFPKNFKHKTTQFFVLLFWNLDIRENFKSTSTNSL